MQLLFLPVVSPPVELARSMIPDDELAATQQANRRSQRPNRQTAESHIKGQTHTTAETAERAEYCVFTRVTVCVRLLGPFADFRCNRWKTSGAPSCAVSRS